MVPFPSKLTKKNIVLVDIRRNWRKVFTGRTKIVLIYELAKKTNWFRWRNSLSLSLQALTRKTTAYTIHSYTFCSFFILLAIMHPHKSVSANRKTNKTQNVFDFEIPLCKVANVSRTTIYSRWKLHLCSKLCLQVLLLRAWFSNHPKMVNHVTNES